MKISVKRFGRILTSKDKNRHGCTHTIHFVLHYDTVYGLKGLERKTPAVTRHKLF